MTEKIIVELNMEDGSKIVVFDRLMSDNSLGKLHCARNIYKIDKSDSTVWQVSSPHDEYGDPFTNIWIDEGGDLLAYRWDGGSYSINPTTGLATPRVFLR